MTASTDNNTTLTAYAGKNITVSDVTFDNGVVAAVSSLTLNNNAVITNPHADTLALTETIIAVEGDLVTTGMNRQGNVWHAYGGFQDSTATITISQGDFAQVTNAAGDLFTAVEVDGFTMSGDTLIFTNAGDYFGEVSLTYTTTNGNSCTMRIYNVTDAAINGFKTGSTGMGANYSTFTMPLYFEAVSAGDRFVLEVTNIDASNDIVAKFSTFYIAYLHD